ncbi:MAG TPA: type 3 dihydrofolate reductase [Gammaproteobacteria bacterium]|nr:type 3 dihydrofolate reductase [Gammaproteobacteria bacterium]
MISLIAAMSLEHAIGKENRMPWHLPADLKHFKAITLNKPVIMGRRTFESIGKALPLRTNIVITQHAHLVAPGCIITHSFTEAIRCAGEAEEIMVIGGGQLYQEAIKTAKRMYLTLIDINVHGDTFFPKWHKEEWQEVSRQVFEKDLENPYDYTFVVLERV